MSPLLGAVFLALTLAGCSATPEELYDASGVLLERRDPAMFRLAVAPFELSPGFETGLTVAGLRRSAGELQADLVRALAEQRATSEVFATSSQDSFEAYTQQADLLLRPRLEDARFRHAGTNGRAVLSTLLWITTWVGSFWVEDSTYEAHLRLTYDLIDPHTGGLVTGGRASTEQTDLSFWDRNPAFSPGFFVSMFLPPYLASDDRNATENALVGRANSFVAAQLKSFLIDDLPHLQSQLFTNIRIFQPLNGATVDGTVDLGAEISSARGVAEVLVFVNGTLYHRWGRADLPTLEEQVRQDPPLACAVQLEAIDRLTAGKNLIRLMVNVAGQWSSRSVFVYNEGAASVASAFRPEAAEVEGEASSAGETNSELR